MRILTACASLMTAITSAFNGISEAYKHLKIWNIVGRRSSYSSLFTNRVAEVILPDLASYRKEKKAKQQSLHAQVYMMVAIRVKTGQEYKAYSCYSTYSCQFNLLQKTG